MTAGMVKLPGTKVLYSIEHIPHELRRFIWYALKEKAQITVIVIIYESKEIPVEMVWKYQWFSSSK